MKITAISHAYQDERYLAALDAMAKLPDMEVSLIHPLTYKGKNYRWSSRHAVRDLPVPVIFGSRQGSLLYRPFALAKALDRSDPDVILHEQEVYTLGAAQVVYAARERSIPLAQFVWENVDRALSLPRRMLRGLVLRSVGALIAGSDGARRIHQGWGFNGLMETMPQMGVRVRFDPAFHPRTSGALKICYVGRLVPCKGVDCLLRAVEGLYRRGIAVACVIVGEGRERKRLESLAKRLGVWTQVHFRGQLSGDRVRELLGSSDALVLPSRRTRVWEEQFGLVLAEAMAEGTVAVGSRTGAIQEVIAMDELLFDEDDVQGLVRILDRLATDPSFVVHCKRFLWQRAADAFSAGRVAAQKAEFLQRVLRVAALANHDSAVVNRELQV